MMKKVGLLIALVAVALSARASAFAPRLNIKKNVAVQKKSAGAKLAPVQK